MKKVLANLYSAFFLFSLFFYASASVKKTEATIYINAGVGTQGISFSGSYYWKNLIGLRGTYDYMPSVVTKPVENIAKNASDVIYSASSKFSSWGFDASVRPFRGAFRIDVGFRMMDYGMSVNGSKQFNVGNSIPVNVDVDGKFKFTIAKGIKPYFGLGWDFNPVAGLTIGFDVGAIYTGKWKASVADIKTTYNVGNAGLNGYRSISRVARNDLDAILQDLGVDTSNQQIDVDSLIEQYGDEIFTTDDNGNEIDLNTYVEQQGREHILDTLLNRYSDDILEGVREVYNIRGDINGAVPDFARFWPVVKLNIGYKFDIFDLF